MLRGSPIHCRFRAKLAVRGRSNSPKIGIFAAGTHQIVDIPDCAVHHPLINRAVRGVKFWIRKRRIQPYREVTRRGLLRYLQVVVNRLSQSVQLSLVINSESPEVILPHLSDLFENYDIPLHSLWVNTNTSPGNNIFGPNWFLFRGLRFSREKILRADVFFHPGAFGQANLPLSERMVSSALASLSPGEKVLELYAGTGAFGLNTLLSFGATVAFNEVSPWSLAGLRRSLSLLPSEFRRKAAVYPGPAEDFAHLVENFDAVIADPPRKGLHPKITEALSRSVRPKKFIYISCHLPSLLRDAELLLSSGKWAVRGLELFDLFPHTEHIEGMAVFERRG